MTSKMTDRELSELAAKAAGIDGEWSDAHRAIHVNTAPLRNFVLWSPLTDDGDALRLSVKLHISIAHEWRNGVVYVDVGDAPIGCEQEYGSDPYAATRRAIVRAAAEIGKAQESGAK